MADIERNNRIDEYLTVAMSESEKAAFEKDLAEDKNLSDEVDAQRTIAGAVQTAHLRNMLADIEVDLQVSVSCIGSSHGHLPPRHPWSSS